MKVIRDFILEKKLVLQFILFLFLGMGFFTVSEMNREAFPNVALDKVVIEAVLPGATSEEIERLIAIPIEKQLRSVSRIDKVRSYNLENVSVIMIFLEEGSRNTQKILDDIKDAVSSARLPSNAITPKVHEITTEKQEVIQIALSLKKPTGDSLEDYRKLRNLAKFFEDRLFQVKEIAEIQKFGYRDRQFLVEVDPVALNNNQIGLNTLLNALGSRNIDTPSGVLKLDGNEFLLRTKGEFQEATDMLNVPLVGNEIGYSTLVRNVARVFDSFKDVEIYERVNGTDSIVLRVWKTGQADIIVTSQKVKALIHNLEDEFPEASIYLFDDRSNNVIKQIGDLGVNFATGLILVVVVLFFILGPRLSLIVSLAIPSIFLIAFNLIKQTGTTINTVSIFGLVMVLGMMVDNSIVVSENTYRLMQEGITRKEAIEKTFKDVLLPLIVSMLVISAAFVPLLFLSGIVGKFIVAIPTVILLTLFVSLLFSLTFLPNWLNIFLPEKLKTTHKHNEPDEQTGAFAFVTRIYKKTMQWVVKRRYIVLLLFTLLFVFSLFLSSKYLHFMFFPSGGEEDIELKSWMPIGTTLEKNLSVIHTIEPVLKEITGGDLKYMRTRVGVHEAPAVDPKPGQEAHRAHIMLKLIPENERSQWFNGIDLVNAIRTAIDKGKASGTIDKKLFLDVSAKVKGPPIGKPVSIEIKGQEYSVIQEIAGKYIEEMKKIDGVYDIRIDLEEGKEEYRFRVNDSAAIITDISARDIARAIRTAYNGEIASSISKGEDKINILVRYPELARLDVNSLKEVKVENRSRRLIPLDQVTYVTKERSFSMINRQDLLRIVRLEASIDTSKATSLAVNTRLRKSVNLEPYKGYKVNFGGEQEDAQKSFRDLGISMLLAIAVIFIIFIIYFNSIGTTGVIISSIPFGIVGVLFALITHGKPLSFMSMLAIVALSGSIVANTLILITFIEELRAGGMELDEAIVKGGEIRLRPIFLTTLTTVIGLLPSAYGFPTLDRFVQPLSLAFGWGLLFATGVTLVFVPTVYRVKEDLVRLFKFRKKTPV
ncbi:MAG: efflux RND transporter permease subunit [Leptospiraceae bacterium]|nr:efflux RND transporter permease subunit [Leptospiraceae bacterium]MCP5513478.1 efflux RND transporter permease subunit [Leptospiraceae bacterium]